MSASEVLHDKDIREPLFDFLEETYGKVRIIEEKRTGAARADVVMVTPRVLYGIEIKSDADTYARLKKQVRYYNWYYDRNIIVAGTKHAAHVEEHVPEWWGIVTVEMENGRTDFYQVRDPKPNPKVKLASKLSLLWRPELASVQERCHVARYSGKSKAFVQEKLLEKVPKEILQKEIIHALFERDYTLIEAEIDAYRKRKQ